MSVNGIVTVNVTVPMTDQPPSIHMVYGVGATMTDYIVMIDPRSSTALGVSSGIKKAKFTANITDQQSLRAMGCRIGANLVSPRAAQVRDEYSAVVPNPA
jgi:hypothetical protein